MSAEGRDGTPVDESTPVPEQAFDTAPFPGESYVEGPYLVFTAAYHLRRGYCCNSDCRHCPYR